MDVEVCHGIHPGDVLNGVWILESGRRYPFFFFAYGTALKVFSFLFFAAGMVFEMLSSPKWEFIVSVVMYQ